MERRRPANCRIGLRLLTDDVLPFVREDDLVFHIGLACSAWRKAAVEDVAARRVRRQQGLMRVLEQLPHALSAAPSADRVAAAFHGHLDPLRRWVEDEKRAEKIDQEGERMGNASTAAGSSRAMRMDAWRDVAAAAILGGQLSALQLCWQRRGDDDDDDDTVEGAGITVVVGGGGARATPTATRTKPPQGATVLSSSPAAFRYPSTLKGASAVHLAAWSGDVRMLAFIVANGGQMTARDERLAAVVHYAAKSGSLPMIIYCVSHGGGKMSDLDGDLSTVLHYAAQSGSPAMMRFCVANGGGSFDDRNDGLERISHCAARSGRVDALCLALEGEARSGPGAVLSRTLRGSTVIDYALASKDDETIRHCRALSVEEQKHLRMALRSSSV